MSEPLNIAVLAFPGISPFHLSVPCLVFGEAYTGFPAMNCVVCAEQTGQISSSAGFEIGISRGLEAISHADIVILPSWHAGTPVSVALRQALLDAAARGAYLAGLCLGAYVLAECGLLNGLQATTHWAYADDFSQRFPQIWLDTDVIYIEQGRIMTSAGTAAALDCCLHLVRQLCGAEVANRLARRLVIAPHRQGGQAQFIEQPVPETRSDHKLSSLLDEVRNAPQLAYTLDQLAAKMAMSRRTFTRHFRQLTGSSFTEWLLHQRISHAQHLLEVSDLAVEQVATAAGFASAETLRLHFRQRLGIPPQQWRRQFRQT
jgi:transcriptional regulator GlxA family with amidase domain